MSENATSTYGSELGKTLSVATFLFLFMRRPLNRVVCLHSHIFLVLIALFVLWLAPTLCTIGCLVGLMGLLLESRFSVDL